MNDPWGVKAPPTMCCWHLGMPASLVHPQCPGRRVNL